jgi:hypothetical protein
MFHKLFTRRRGVAVATVALGISGMSLAVRRNRRRGDLP